MGGQVQPQMHHQPQVPVGGVVNYTAGAPVQMVGQAVTVGAVPYDSGMNALANATSNSEESSLLIAGQKKSLEVITERQSEFSNTMGTYANGRPSQRSKQSKAQSTGTKNNAGSNRGHHPPSLNNSSNVLINNSAAGTRHPANHKNGGKVGSFVDITD